MKALSCRCIYCCVADGKVQLWLRQIDDIIMAINSAPNIYESWPKFPRLHIATESRLGERRDHIYLNILNHSWRNDYDWGYTENTLTALYCPDQLVLIGSNYFPQNNHQRKGIGVTHVCYYGPEYVYGFCTGIYDRNQQSASE